MRIAYFDCFSGISGDMILGALLDTGLDIKVLEDELKKLRLKGYRIKKRKVKRGALAGTKFEVILEGGLKKKSFTPREMIALVEESSLKGEVKVSAGKIFRRLGRAEAAAHGSKLKDVRFHQLGDADTIIDVVGVSAALVKMGIERIFCSPLTVGSGRVKSPHGSLPLPAPATLNLLKGRKIVFSSILQELVTPTGAGIISTLAESDDRMPPLVVTAVGYGAGTANREDLPNLLRVVIGESDTGYRKDEVVVLETNIDDLNPLSYEPLIESLKTEGALEVYLTPVQMKKSRPACLVTVILPPHRLERISSRIFAGTTTFGVRYHYASRMKLARELVPVKTRYGEVRVKVGKAGGSTITVSPEYEDCLRRAREKRVTFRQVYEEAVFLTHRQKSDKLL